MKKTKLPLINCDKTIIDNLFKKFSREQIMWPLVLIDGAIRLSSWVIEEGGKSINGISFRRYPKYRSPFDDIEYELSDWILIDDIGQKIAGINFRENSEGRFLIFTYNEAYEKLALPMVEIIKLELEIYDFLDSSEIPDTRPEIKSKTDIGGPNEDGFALSGMLSDEVVALPEAVVDSNTVSAESIPSNDMQPWEKIKNKNWDRLALKMWWEGNSRKEIARKVSVSARRVTNRLSELRQMYGDEIVPTHEQRRKRFILKNS